MGLINSPAKRAYSVCEEVAEYAGMSAGQLAHTT